MYTTMKKLAMNANARLRNGTMTNDEYIANWETMVTRLDMFLAFGRITDMQYQELMEMKVSVS